MYLVISPFGFEGRMWDLIVSVPDHCLSFYFFNPKERQIAYRCEFRNCRMQNNENPVEFGSALRRLGQKAYPDLSVEALEVHLIDHFVMGLGSFDLQKHVQLQHPKN